MLTDVRQLYDEKRVHLVGGYMIFGMMEAFPQTPKPCSGY